jgi:hypothetical protein
MKNHQGTGGGVKHESEEDGLFRSMFSLDKK